MPDSATPMIFRWLHRRKALPTILPARASALMPAQGTLVHGDRFTRTATVR